MAGTELGGEPVIKAMIVGLRLPIGVESRVEMPFAVQGGLVTGLLQQRWKSNFVFGQVHFRGAVVGDPIVDTGSIGRASGEQSGARRRAHRGGGVEMGAAPALGCEFIDVGRFYFLMPEAGEIAVAQVIRQEDDYVRLHFICLRPAKQWSKKQKAYHCTAGDFF